MTETIESLDFAERWLRDGLAVRSPPAFIQTVTVDMTAAVALVERFRAEGTRITFMHLAVRAAALAMAEHADLHQLIAGARRYRPDEVDIGLSVSGESFVAPVLVIASAAKKDLLEIAAEIRDGAQKARQRDAEMHAALRRWGWILPFGFLRRAFMRLFFLTFGFVRATGTLQITSSATVDTLVPLSFSTSAIVTVGRVRDDVIAVDGKAVVRPVMTLVCTADHRVWDGRAGARFLNTVKALLESEALVRSGEGT